MKWKPKHTDVVEKAADAIYEALRRSIEDHEAAMREIRREFKERHD